MATEATSVIERIKQKLDIVEEIGAVVPLKKSGKAFKGLCPFHGERTPSFYVFPDKQDWHCFGCGERGDLITFVRSNSRSTSARRWSCSPSARASHWITPPALRQREESAETVGPQTPTRAQ